VEDDLVGSQLSLGTPKSLPLDKVVSKLLSLYSSLLALQAQHALSEHDKIIFLALKNIQDDKRKEGGKATALTLSQQDPPTS
jgi:hypothetical protein